MKDWGEQRKLLESIVDIDEIRVFEELVALVGQAKVVPVVLDPADWTLDDFPDATGHHLLTQKDVEYWIRERLLDSDLWGTLRPLIGDAVDGSPGILERWCVLKLPGS